MDDPLRISPAELVAQTARLRRLAVALTADPPDVDDLVQDALGAALAARMPIRDLPRFLRGSLRRRAAELRRGAARRRRRELDHAEDRGNSLPGADAVAARAETMRIVLEEIERLPAAQKDAVLLRYLDGLEPAEIARRTQVESATVRAHIARGLATLRERLNRRASDRSTWIGAMTTWMGAIRPERAADAATAVPATTLGHAASSALTKIGVAVMLKKLLLAGLAPAALLGMWLAIRPAENATVERTSVASAPHEESRSLTPVEPPSSRARSAALPVAAEDLPGAATTEDGTHVIEGSVVDACTGEPVPDLEVVVSPVRTETRGPAMERRAHLEVRTKDDGTFRADAAWPTGDVVVRIVDEHGQLPMADDRGVFTMPSGWFTTRLAHPFATPFSIGVGPTFRLSAEIPHTCEAHQFEARFRPSGPATKATARVVSLLRSGPLPWVRFPVEATELEGDGPWILEVTHEDGLWTGSAVVSRKIGVEPAPVEFRIEPRGVIAFEVVAEGGASVPLGFVDLASFDGAYERRVHLVRHSGDNARAFRSVGLLAGGPYRWTAGSRSGRVEVLEGEVVEVSIDVTSESPTFDLDVPVDATATPDLDLSQRAFTIMNAEEFGRSFSLRPERVPGSPPGSWRLPVRGLTEGRWGVVPPGEPVEVRWSPARIELVPGLPPPTIVTHHRGPGMQLEVLVVEARTGAPIANAETAFAIDSRSYAYHRTNGDGRVRIPVVGDTEVHLLVRSAGRRTASLHVDPERQGTSLTIELESGWGTVVRVLRAGSLLPVPDVEVLVDGITAGRTNRHGILPIDGDGPPDRLELGPGSPPVQKAPSPEAREGGPPPLKGWTFVVSG
ncbi:MAG: RNA polymerase sigma factor [Planctomycetota bacterium]